MMYGGSMATETQPLLRDLFLLGGGSGEPDLLSFEESVATRYETCRVVSVLIGDEFEAELLISGMIPPEGFYSSASALPVFLAGAHRLMEDARTLGVDFELQIDLASGAAPLLIVLGGARLLSEELLSIHGPVVAWDVEAALKREQIFLEDALDLMALTHQAAVAL